MSLSPAPHPARTAVVGVFDSGVGGLSVLKALRARLPNWQLLYAADSGYAPYGERTPAFVVERSQRIVQHLLGEGADTIVVACNTATALAIDTLRGRWPDVAFVGVEPGLKPALAATRNGRIGVMATQGTLDSERFRRLVHQHATSVELHLQPCPGLAGALERGDADGADVRHLVERFTGPLRAAGVDTVVLGCTHYPFAGRAIAEALGPAVTLIDTAEAIARRVESLAALAVETSAGDTASPMPELWTTAQPQDLQRIAARWLDFEVAGVRPL